MPACGADSGCAQQGLPSMRIGPHTSACTLARAPAHALPMQPCLPPWLPPLVQAIAAVLSDGGLALLCSVEDDLWEETLEEQLLRQPWGRCVEAGVLMGAPWEADGAWRGEELPARRPHT